jgi:protocatechuate 3,4-dioxygenase beta subunit
MVAVLDHFRQPLTEVLGSRLTSGYTDGTFQREAFMTRTRLLLAGLVLFSASLAAQTPPAAPAQDVSISGRVVDGVTGKGIAGATVAAAGADGGFSVGSSPSGPAVQGPFMTETDQDGGFTLLKLPIGKVMLGASKSGYLYAFHGQLGPDDTGALGTIVLIAGERHPPFVIKLWPPARISGVVLDDLGDPVVGASVRLWRLQPSGTGSMSSSGTTRTDDRGWYQLLNVRPGDFIVGVSTPVGSALSPATFYPDAIDIANAGTVRLSGGDVRDGVNVISRRRPATSSVTLTGRLIGPAERVANAIVRLIPVGTADPTGQLEGWSITASSDGAFRFPNAAPGDYRLFVASFPPMVTMPALRFTASGAGYSMPNLPTDPRGPQPPLAKLPNDDTFWADVAIDLAKSVTDLEVPLRAGARIRGRVEFDMTRPVPNETQRLSSALLIVQALERSISLIPQSRLEADGTFTSIGLPSGSYAISRIFPPWYASDAPLEGPSDFITSVRVNGEERFGEAFQLGTEDLNDVVVTVTDKKMGIVGTVSDAQGKPTPLARVVLFPRQPSQRLPLLFPSPRLAQQLVLDQTGRFNANVQRAGDYLIAAIDSIPRDWNSPAFLESLTPIATRVTLALGEKKTVDLRVRALP